MSNCPYFISTSFLSSFAFRSLLCSFFRTFCFSILIELRTYCRCALLSTLLLLFRFKNFKIFDSHEFWEVLVDFICPPVRFGLSSGFGLPTSFAASCSKFSCPYPSFHPLCEGYIGHILLPIWVWSLPSKLCVILVPGRLHHMFSDG